MNGQKDAESFAAWGQIAKQTGAQMWFWYYPVNYNTYLTDSPNIINIWYDFKYVVEECNVTGIFYEGGGAGYLFEKLKAHLATMLMWSFEKDENGNTVFMSFEEFCETMKEYLYIFYGDGYEYIYDTEGVTIDLKQKNSNVSINDSVSLINKLKNSRDFSKAKMNGVLAINNSSELISEPNINFLVYREVTLSDNENTHTYFIQQNFTSDGKSSKLESEEENYQINDDYASFITNYKDDSQSVYCNIDDEEFESIDKDTPEYIIVQSMISKLDPLKELLKSTPKTYKDIKLEQQKENTKKTIR